MKYILLSTLIFSFLGCSSSQKGSSTSTTTTSSRTTYKNERIQTLPNGLKVYFVEDNTLPQVGLQLLIPVGTVTESSKQAGINALTAQLLDQGTKTKNAIQLADLFADAGSEFDASPSHDFTILSTGALTTQFSPVLELFAEVLTKPAFTNEDFERLRQQTLVQIKAKRDRSGTWADYLMMQKFYGDSPYARDVRGSEETLTKMTRQEIQNFYKTHYVPKGSILAVTGRFTPEMEQKIIAKFSEWQSEKGFAKPQLKMTQAPQSGVMKIETPHKAQTEIRLIQSGVSRAHPDYLKLRLANEILGGSFASRLNQKVRDDLGLTYSIYSYLDTRDQAGAWVVSTFSKNETAQKTVDETVGVLKRYVETGAEQKELDAAKNLVKAQFPRAMETADKLAFNLLVLDFYGVGTDYLINFNRNVDSYSLADINETIRKYLKPEQMLIMSFN